MPLIFLRHSKPDAADGLCYGRTDLEPAPDLDTIVQRLDETLPDVTRIVSSPLTRCQFLAQALGHKRQIKTEIDHNLIEMDFGTWENTPWNDIDRHALDTWADDFFHARPHGGESVAILQKRVRTALRNLDNTPTLWVSHAGVYRALMAQTNHPDPWNARIDFATFQAITLP
jgi:alpha-ribazole phosphatase